MLRGSLIAAGLGVALLIAAPLRGTRPPAKATVHAPRHEVAATHPAAPTAGPPNARQRALGSEEDSPTRSGTPWGAIGAIAAAVSAMVAILAYVHQRRKKSGDASQEAKGQQTS
jgi:hypothetical protein